MADTTTVPAAANAEAGKQTPATTITAPTTVSVEEFNSLKSDLAKVTAALTSLHASTRVAKKEKEPDAPDTNSVAGIRAEMKARETAVDRGSIALDMRQVIAALKPTAGSEEYIEAFLEKSMAGKVAYDWTQRKTIVTTNDGMGELSVPLADYVAGLDKAGKFNAFKAAPVADRSKPAQGGFGPAMGETITGDEMRRQLAEGTYDVKKKYRITN